jgi:CubicO group peptidase (beta-lactamase class C family)
LAKRGVKKPADAVFLYSNLGVGLLGQALANRAQTSYPDLVKAEVTGPLGMRDTVVSLSPEQQPASSRATTQTVIRFVPGTWIRSPVQERSARPPATC